MKKNIQWTMSLLLIAMLLLSFGACAEATEQPTPAVTTAAPEETTEAPEETTEASEETNRVLRTLEPGIAEAPTPEPLPLEGVIIGIDPGHQAHANSEKEQVAPWSKEKKKKVSSGTAGKITRVAEYIVNLDVSLQLRDALEALGAKVVMSRTTHDVNISNVERAKLMNEANVDLWLRIHCNGSENSKAHGMGMYVVESGDTAEESYRAGECLLEAMGNATGAKKTGVHVSDNYSGNNWSTRPCVLVEMGYMSNAEEDAKLNTPDYQKLLVSGMVEGIRAFVGK